MKNPKDSENASRKAPAAACQHRSHTAISPRHEPVPKTRDLFDQMQSHRDRMAPVSAMHSHKSANIYKIAVTRCAPRRLPNFPCQPHRNRIFCRPACGIGSAHRKMRVDVASQNGFFTGGFSDGDCVLLRSSSVGRLCRPRLPAAYARRLASPSPEQLLDIAMRQLHPGRPAMVALARMRRDLHLAQ